MNFQQAVTSAFSKYVTFSGRAARSEFWYFALFCFVGGLFLSGLDAILFGWMSGDVRVLGAIFSLVTVLPSISVAVRRLHDTERSGWWWWLVLIPIVGWIILIIWYATEGTKGDNDYGADPLSGSDGGAGISHRSSIPSVNHKD